MGMAATRMAALVCLVGALLTSMAVQAQDADLDGYVDSQDNCSALANGVAGSNQRDADFDGYGNACDADFDNDGVVGGTDFGVFLSCFQGQTGHPDDPDCSETDMDFDGYTTTLDFGLFLPLFGSVPGPSGLACAGTLPCLGDGFLFQGDADGDGVAQTFDTCATVANPDQRDADHDGIGSLCDADINNDGTVNPDDQALLFDCLDQFVPGNGPAADVSCAESDLDGSGRVDQQDKDLLNALLASGVPGPSGRPCASATATGAPCQVGQQPDPFYTPVLERPSFAAGVGPVVAVDSTHNNFHTASGRYTGFARLLEADGYVVQDFATPYSSGCEFALADCDYFQALLGIDVLVISNAQQTLSAEEAALLRGWVDGSLGCPAGNCSRTLVLIADHQANFDFPLRVAALASELGLTWPNNNVSTRTFSRNPPFDPQSGGELHTGNAIVAGTDIGRKVESVTTFFGSGFVDGPVSQPNASLLRLPAGASTTGPGGVADAEGYSQGVAFALGTGRVYASGEAAMFSAQVTRFAGRVGMHALPRRQNQQYLLNLMRWLVTDCAGPPACQAFGGQAPDCNYAPSIASPSYGFCGGPTLLVDTTHGNFHQITPLSPQQPGRYWGFSRLLFEDGYHVADSAASIEQVASSGARILVMANPTVALSERERNTLVDWVNDGGRLLLIFDHQPFDTVELLLPRFGLARQTRNQPQFTFTRNGGGLSETSIISNGTASDQVINEVTTFLGATFVPLPTLPPYTTVEPVLELPTGELQGAAVRFGAGRVYVAGEAGGLTAQATFSGFTFGMHVTPDNEQYLLNVVRWLDGQLD